MNSGANLRRAASTAERVIFSSRELSTCTALGAKPRPPSTRPFISAAPRLEVMMMMQLERSTRRLSPSVSVALSRIPSSSCHRESEAFSISSKSRIESFSFSVCHWLSASCVSRGCVSRWPRYPGGEPMSLAISCECWNSAQSILMQARASPKRDSATASTTRVLPEPVGPRNRRLPTGRPGAFSPARNI